MILIDYRHPGGLNELDPMSGAVRPAPEGALRDEWGFVCRQSGKWFAIRSDDESLLFQHGAATWRLRPENEFDVSGRLFRQFTIRREEHAIFSLKYRRRLGGPLLSIIDPTYDAMDDEADDFFVYVANMWREWKDLPMSAFEARTTIAMAPKPA
jgi:hypothetical protein